MRWFLSALWAICLVQNVQALVFEASVEQTQVPMGEAFNLNISYTGNDGASLQPDLSVLQTDFTVYSTSSSTQVSYINGQQSQRQDWDIGLLPKKEGKIVIPAIQAGKYQTKPIEIEVLAAGVQPALAADKVQNDNVLAQTVKFSADLDVDNKEPYLQQQVNAVLTIRDAGGLQLTEEPLFTQPDDWIVKTLQQPTVTMGSDNVREIKFYYALFPQKSGSQEIPPVNVKGFYLSIDKSRAHPLLSAQNFGGFFQMLDFDFDNLFGSQKPVSLFTKPIKINVKPAVAGYGNNWWLPASSLSVTSRWGDNNGEKVRFRYNEPVSREIVLTASGVADTQLPELMLPETPFFKQYPEKPQLSMETSGKEMISQSVIRVVYIPQQDGKLVLPEIRIPWFNTRTNKMETAVLPSETIDVDNPYGVAVPPAAGSSEATVVQTPEIKAAADKKVQNTTDKTPWAMIVLLVMGAFIFGLVISYLLFHQSPRIDGNKSVSGWLNDIRRNLKQKDFRALRDNLLKWGSEVFKNSTVQNLNDLAELVNNQDFTAQVQKLNSILYGNTSDVINEDVLMKVLKSVGNKDRKKPENKPLPNLYK